MMKAGVSFANAFCTTALCNPSRTSIVTGMNPFKTSIHDNRTHWWDHVAPRLTFPALFKAGGWRVFFYGKVTSHDHAIWQTSGIANPPPVRGGSAQCECGHCPLPK
jgi:arylsulfatase A-like enzyme